MQNWAPQSMDLARARQPQLPDQMPAADDFSPPLVALLTLWHGRFRIAIATTTLFAAVLVYAVYVAPRFFTAHAVVALNDRQEQAIMIDSVMSGLSGSGASVYTEVEVLRSRNLADALVRTLSLTDDPEFNPALQHPGWAKTWFGQTTEQLDEKAQFDAVVDAVLDALSVANIRQSFVFRVGFTTRGAEKSAVMANTLADLYILDQLQTKFEATEKATVWLSGRTAELKLRLETAETAAKSFSASISFISPEALEATNRQLKDLRERLAAARAARSLGAERAEELRRALSLGDHVAMMQAAGSTDLSNLSSGAETFAAAYETIVRTQATDLARIDAQLDALAASAEALEQRIEDQSADMLQLTQLQREAEASRQIYEFFLARLKETEVQKGIQRADARILSRAVVPQSSSAPRLGLLASVATLAGLLLGAVWVLLDEALRISFATSASLERATATRVLAQIPTMPVPRRSKLVAYLAANDRSPAVEAVRNLRTSVLMSGQSRPKVILMTSSQPGEGKTTHAIMLAQSYARLGKSVLLIEGDVRKRSFSEYFTANARGGIVSAISKPDVADQYIRRCESLGFDVIMGEPTQINAADLFSSTQFATFLDLMREKYAVILLDMPPILAVPDARIAATNVDAVIYAVRWGRTPRGQIVEGIKLLRSIGAPLIGVAITRMEPKQARRYGNHGYGTQGAYGDQGTA